ncbi:MAG: hypothetical protein OEZ68_21635 [Gammaproteobacteria bacterium]|nr:hypothetical protein [Gammaproteobacteria bacterium]MDH5803402.1 hypothetical protein [Gammaproteobacteria bacterium]
MTDRKIKFEQAQLNLREMYKENGRTARAILDWRYKVMTRYFVSMGLCGAAFKWVYETEGIREYSFVPLLLAALVSISSYFMDRANNAMLSDQLKTGAKIEEKMGCGIKGWYTISYDRVKPYYSGSDGYSYSVILKWLYLLSFFVLFLLALVSMEINFESCYMSTL